MIDRTLVRRHFSDHATEYDRYARVQREVVDELVASMDGLIPASGSFLDIGCGTGFLSLALLDRAPGLDATLVDLSPGMVEVARERFPQAQVMVADAVSLPSPDATFDLVVSSSVYQWVEDLPAAFREARRVLRPGGTFAVALFGSRTLHELRDSHTAALRGAGSCAESHMQRFPDIHHVSRALQMAGFAASQVRSEEVQEWHPSVRDLFTSLKKIGAQNANDHRPHGIPPRRTALLMQQHYESTYGRAGRIPATYEVISFQVKA